ncbi:MAG: phage terminase large subunit family protein [Rhodospirillales bacterium]|nr:phage terminase large subunit family protein [Rhodospirillales bacterium]
MPSLAQTALLSTDILPVRCPACGEAQNTLEGAADPLAEKAQVSCMVCGYVFGAAEYRQLLAQRQQEFALLQLGQL